MENGEQIDKEVSCGVPQGLVLGPDLWNLLYDDLLCMELPFGVQMVAFADDVALVATAQIYYLLEEMLSELMDIVVKWT